MDTLVNSIQRLCSLIDNRQRCANRSVLNTLTSRHFTSTRKLITHLKQRRNKLHQGWRYILIRQWHKRLLDRQTTSLNAHSATRRNTEFISFLPLNAFRINKPREVREHASIKHLTNCRSHALSQITNDMEKPNAINP